MRKKILLCPLLLVFNYAIAQIFGNQGKVTTDISGNNDILNAEAFQEDGKLVVAGSTASPGNNFSVVRYNNDGTLDKSFNGSGIVTTKIGDIASASSLAIQKDGKIVVAGFTGTSAGFNFIVIRYNIDGSYDKTFDADGIVTTNIKGGDKAYAVAIQTDGKIVVGGSSAFERGSISFVLARYNIDGSLDNSFGEEGISIILNGGVIYALAIQDDNKIVAAGFKYKPYFFSFFAVVRYNSNGTPDNSFGSNGIVTKDMGPNNQFNAVAIQPDGKILATGYSRSPVSTQFVLFRYNDDGSTDKTFNGTGEIATDTISGFNNASSIALQNGKIVLAGSNFIILRFNGDGSLDKSFYESGIAKIDFEGRSGGASSAKIYNNNIYVGGSIDNGTDGVTDYDFAVALLASKNEDHITCPASVTVSVNKGKCNAIVNNIAPVLQTSGALINYIFTGATTASGEGNASGKIFNKGVTEVVYFLKNDLTEKCLFTVKVKDIEAPIIIDLSSDKKSLWPPNHKMQTVMLKYKSEDNCEVTSCNIIVTSNEQVNGTAPDWIIINDHEIKLRAERNGNGNGRIYTVNIVCTDGAANHSRTATTTVTVPKSKGSNRNQNPPVNASVLPINKTLSVYNITVYPNPSRQDFKIRIQQNPGADSRISLKVYDVAGRVMETQERIGADQTIAIGAKLHSGVYFAEVLLGNEKKIFKLVKQ